MRTVSRDLGVTPACSRRAGAYRAAVTSQRWSHKQFGPASQDRRARNKMLPAHAAADATMLAAPLVQAFQGVADTYGSALQHYPLETKAGTTAITYGMGDIMAQSADNRRMGRQFSLDFIRLRNFAVRAPMYIQHYSLTFCSIHVYVSMPPSHLTGGQSAQAPPDVAA